MDTQALDPLVAELAQALQARGHWLATAESCTGGLIAAACTERAGSSAWFERGVVSYSNAAKSEWLGVRPELIAVHGAVSEPVARAMALGLLARTRAGTGPATDGLGDAAAAPLWAVAVTGIAGPGGGSPDKPVGTVWIAWAVSTSPACGGEASALLATDRAVCETACHAFGGDRAAVREATVRAALQGLLARLSAWG
jgi:nicotinamide-nucleotide amidase